MARSAISLWYCLLLASSVAHSRVAPRVADDLSKAELLPVNEAVVVTVADQTMTKPIPGWHEPRFDLFSRMTRFWSAIKSGHPLSAQVRNEIASHTSFEMRLGQSDHLVLRAQMQSTSEGLKFTNVAIAGEPASSYKNQGLTEHISPFHISSQSAKRLLAKGKIVKRSDGAVFVRDVSVMTSLLRRDEVPSVQADDPVPHKYKMNPITDDEAAAGASGDDSNATEDLQPNSDNDAGASHPVPTLVVEPALEADESRVIVVPLDFEPEKGSFTIPLHDIDGDDIVEVNGKKYKIHGSQTVGYEMIGTGLATFSAKITSQNNAIYTQPITEVVTVLTQPVTETVTHIATSIVPQAAPELTTTVVTQVSTELITSVVTQVSTELTTSVITQVATEEATSTVTKIATEVVTKVITVTTQVLVPAPEPTIVHDATPPQVHHVTVGPEYGSPEITVSGADGDLTIVHPATEEPVPAPSPDSKHITYFEPLTGDHVYVEPAKPQ